jgi:hypothetical protein
MYCIFCCVKYMAALGLPLFNDPSVLSLENLLEKLYTIIAFTIRRIDNLIVV